MSGSEMIVWGEMMIAAVSTPGGDTTQHRHLDSHNPNAPQGRDLAHAGLDWERNDRWAERTSSAPFFNTGGQI